MNNILIRIRRPLKRIAHRRIPIHDRNVPAIRQQPNEKAKPAPVDIRITLREHLLLVRDQAVIAIVQHHLDACHMERLTDIIRTMFKNDV